MRMVCGDMPVGIRFQGGLSSSAGESLLKKVSEIRSHQRVTVSAYGGAWALHDLVDDAAFDAQVDDWDDEGSLAASPTSVDIAHQFVECLQAGMPEPEVDVGRRGEITFQWRFGKGKVVLISMYPEGTVGYSVVRGAARHFGRVPFEGEMPPEVLMHIKALLS